LEDFHYGDFDLDLSKVNIFLNFRFGTPVTNFMKSELSQQAQRTKERTNQPTNSRHHNCGGNITTDSQAAAHT